MGLAPWSLSAIFVILFMRNFLLNWNTTHKTQRLHLRKTGRKFAWRERERERQPNVWNTQRASVRNRFTFCACPLVSLSHTRKHTHTHTHTHSLSLSTIWYSTPIKKYWSFYILKLLIEQKVLHDFVLLWSNYNNLEAGGLSWCISPK